MALVTSSDALVPSSLLFLLAYMFICLSFSNIAMPMASFHAADFFAASGRQTRVPRMPPPRRWGCFVNW